MTSKPTLVAQTKAPSPPPAQQGSGDTFNWTDAIPWTLTIVISIATFYLGRRSVAIDNKRQLLIGDIKDLVLKMEQLCPLISAHQGGRPENAPSLEASRKEITELRKTASNYLFRIKDHLRSPTHQSDLETNYFRWKQATEGDSGLITNQKYKWSMGEIKRLETACESFIAELGKMRTQIASGKTRLK